MMNSEVTTITLPSVIPKINNTFVYFRLNMNVIKSEVLNKCSWLSSATVKVEDR